MRIVINGEAATDEISTQKLDELIADLVIDRGDEPMAPGARLPITYPEQVKPEPQSPTIQIEI
jgi:hypothetical protein